MLVKSTLELNDRACHEDAVHTLEHKGCMSHNRHFTPGWHLLYKKNLHGVAGSCMRELCRNVVANFVGTRSSTDGANPHGRRE
jgi:hypothetical protein